MPRIDEEFASSTIKCAELAGREVTLTIRAVEIKHFRDDRGDPEKKVALTFLKTDKELILNKTNRDIIVDLYGYDTDDWIGQRITLYPTRVQFGAKMVDAIRIREQSPPGAGSPAGVAGGGVLRDLGPPPPPAGVGGDVNDEIPF